MIKLTIETINGSITRHYSENHADVVEWYDEIQDMIEVNNQTKL